MVLMICQEMSLGIKAEATQLSYTNRYQLILKQQKCKIRGQEGARATSMKAILLATIALLCITSVCCTVFPWSQLFHVPQRETTHELLGSKVKRQTSDEFQQCLDIEVSIQCMLGGYIQRQVDILSECGADGQAKLQALGCGINHNGQYCGATAPDAIDEITNINVICGAENCSNDCRTILQNLRNDVGCCLALFNTTEYPELDYNLWNNCGVETVEECTINTVNITQRLESEECTIEEWQERLLNFTCSPVNAGPIVDTLNELGFCEDHISNLINICGEVDDEYCLFSGLCSVEQLQNITTECEDEKTLQNCSTNCRDAIVSFSELGCCINSLHNTSAILFETSYGLWDLCEVQSPGFCPSTLSSLVPTSEPETNTSLPTTAPTEGTVNLTTVAPTGISNETETATTVVSSTSSFTTETATTVVSSMSTLRTETATTVVSSMPTLTTETATNVVRSTPTLPTETVTTVVRSTPTLPTETVTTVVSSKPTDTTITSSSTTTQQVTMSGGMITKAFTLVTIVVLGIIVAFSY